MVPHLRGANTCERDDVCSNGFPTLNQRLCTTVTMAASGMAIEEKQELPAGASRPMPNRRSKLYCRIRAILLAVGIVGGMAANAAQLAGVWLPDDREVVGTHLVLNGIALRTYSILHVRVYVAGLYLERRSR